MSMQLKYQNNTLKMSGLRLALLELYFNLLLLKLNKQITEQNNQDTEFSLFLKSLIKYNFIKRISCGKTLLVGEGNLSFISSITTKILIPQNVIASTYESYDESSDLAKHNSFLLSRLGMKILHKIDATRLHKIFNNLYFDTIIFQFPHTGSREYINGNNPNYILVHNFLISAAQKLTTNGTILISAVDNDYYNNIFKFEELANMIGFQKPTKYSFDPEDYKGYEHTMSHMDESALENHKKFATWEFKLCNN